MSKIKKISSTGQASGDVEWPDELLQSERGVQAVHDAVVNTRNRKRAGTASTLCKGEVAGSNRKPWRQKGTGRARAGYRQSPVWRGGGVAFGPRPRDFGGKINKKVARLAFTRALSDKIAAGEFAVLEELSVKSPKTKEFAALMKMLKIERGALFIDVEPTADVKLAVRNIARTAVVRAADVCTTDLLQYPQVFATAAALDALKERVSKQKGGAQ